MLHPSSARVIAVRMGALAGLAILVGSCLEPHAFRCERDVQCDLDGRAGTCEDIGYCSYPDAKCPSQRRFGERAGGSVAGRCVPGPAATDGTSGAGETSAATQGTGSGSSD